MAVTNPFADLIQGMLQGHQIATQLRNQSMHEEAFQRQKESQDRESQLQDIKTQLELNKIGARPVENGMVHTGNGDASTIQRSMNEQPAADAQSPLDQLQGLPTQQSRIMPGTTYRKPIGGQTIQYKESSGNKRSWELPSEAEQRQSAIDDEVKKNNAFEEAKTNADIQRTAMLRRNELALTPGGGIKAPTGFEAQGWQPGEPMTRKEFAEASAKAAAADANDVIIPQGGTLFNKAKGKVVASGAPKDVTGEEAYLDKYAGTLKNPDGTPKTRAQMTLAEDETARSRYKEINADQVLRQNAIQMKQLQEQILRVQQSAMPSEKDYSLFAKSLLDHTLSPTQFQELKSGRIGNLQPARVFSMAKQIDPKFSLAKAESDFKAMEKTEQAFTSGSEAGLTRANNNVLEHLGLLDEAGQALDNGNVQVINRIANAFGVEVGKSAKTTYDLIAKKVSAESEKAFVPGGGSAGERAAGAVDFSSSQSPEQRHNNIRATIHLHDSQQRNLIDQYQRGTYGQGQQQLFTPTAMSTRDRLLAGGTVTYTSNGQTYAIPAAQETEFLKDHPQAVKATNGR